MRRGTGLLVSLGFVVMVGGDESDSRMREQMREGATSEWASS